MKLLLKDNPSLKDLISSVNQDSKKLGVFMALDMGYNKRDIFRQLRYENLASGTLRYVLNSFSMDICFNSSKTKFAIKIYEHRLDKNGNSIHNWKKHGLEKFFEINHFNKYLQRYGDLFMSYITK